MCKQAINHPSAVQKHPTDYDVPFPSSSPPSHSFHCSPLAWRSLCPDKKATMYLIIRACKCNMIQNMWQLIVYISRHFPQILSISGTLRIEM